MRGQRSVLLSMLALPRGWNRAAPTTPLLGYMIAYAAREVNMTAARVFAQFWIALETGSWYNKNTMMYTTQRGRRAEGLLSAHRPIWTHHPTRPAGSRRQWQQAIFPAPRDAASVPGGDTPRAVGKL